MTRSYLSDMEQLVLLSVLRLGQDAAGAQIRQELEDQADRSVAVATIYVTLGRLEERGMVRSWMSDPTPVRGGKRRRHYALEPAGVEALGHAKATWERMWKGVEHALGRDRP
ncbi:MAG: PadR family transcriptional regulator [Gemmatimonadetes bacterium]|nr:PadR family transcriptional regulator [Gemmatimonadota bacterium]